MIVALVLAAGESKRMGLPKPLLRFGRSMGVPPMGGRGILPLPHTQETNPRPSAPGVESAALDDRPFRHGPDARGTHGRDAHATKDADTTFLEQIVRVLQRSEVDRITVVLGAQAQKIQAVTDFSGVDLIINEDYHQGQLSSLIAGLRSVPPETEAILLCLVDNPCITVETVDGLIGAFRVTGKPIVIPVFEGRRGHPALFARSMFDQLSHASADQGARHVVHSNEDQVFEVQVPDPGILVRIDTPQDYLSHFGTAPQIMES
jgi:molybdenum cofactor cytidylyltransferase